MAEPGSGTFCEQPGSNNAEAITTAKIILFSFIDTPSSINIFIAKQTISFYQDAITQLQDTTRVIFH